MTVNELVQKYKYRPLNKELSAKQRQLYLAELPYELRIGEVNGSL